MIATHFFYISSGNLVFFEGTRKNRLFKIPTSLLLCPKSKVTLDFKLHSTKELTNCYFLPRDVFLIFQNRSRYTSKYSSGKEVRLILWALWVSFSFSAVVTFVAQRTRKRFVCVTNFQYRKPLAMQQCWKEILQVV